VPYGRGMATSLHQSWHLQLFGGLRARQGERTLTRFRTQKTGALLAYLAYHLGRSHPREVLIEMLWPDATTPESGRHNLSLALSSLRNQMEPPGVPAGTVIVADRLSVELNPAAVRTDVAAFEQGLRDAAQARDDETRARRLGEAIGYFGGPLLPGYYEEWIAAEQERLNERFLAAVHQFVGLREKAGGDLSDAVAAARRALEVDPVREEAHQDLIRLLLAMEQAEAALRQYREMERVLDAEFGEEPGSASRQLLRRVEAQKAQSQTPATTPVVAAAPLPAPPTLPTGTVTFLLTDIEGSTALWERAGEAFRGALDRHHALLRDAFRRHGGHEIKEAGDSFLVAFAGASDALACAVSAQRALDGADWPREMGGALRVRMALHTGDVQRDAAGEDYHGLVLHRASRMLHAAHGGQILVSEATAALVRRDLEIGLRLQDLGVYRLRDVEQPERLFQIEYPEMARREFPPLVAERAHAGSLPLQFTRFFGREKEITQVGEQLQDTQTRLVTLTGPGGTGKTRLAIEAAGRLIEPRNGAIWFAPLADLSDPALIAGAIVDALGVSRFPGVEPLEQAVTILSSQPSLLVLDNFEQLVEIGGAEIVQELRTRVPTLTVLVTSRHLLGLPGEREFVVPPLPTPGGANNSPESLSAYESVRLFVDRAQAVKPDFQVTNHNAPALAELCDRLEGIPLAIELAAARAQVLTPTRMLAQLSKRFEFLVSRKRGVVERQRTLRAAIDWSFRLLAPELQRFFAVLSTFRGGWTAEAAEAVCEEPLALDYLAQLRECSLVQTEDTQNQMRFRLSETLREYAADQLAPPERDRIAQRHAAYFLDFAEAAEPNLTGPDQAAWLDRLHADHDNLRAAFLVSSLAPPGGDSAAEETLLRWSGVLWRFWSVRGHASEGRRLLSDVLGRVPNTHSTLGRAALRAAALDAAGALAHDQGDYAVAAAHHDESTLLWREIGDDRGLATALNNRGNVALDNDDYEQATRCYEEALALFRASGDQTGAAKVSTNLGALAYDQGDCDRAAALLSESVTIKRDLGNTYGLANSLDLLASVEKDRGSLDRAAALYDEALVLRRSLDHKQGVAMSLTNLGTVRIAQNDPDAANAVLQESLSLFEELSDGRGLAECLSGIAQVAAAQARYEQAAHLLGAVAAQRESLGMTLSPTEQAAEERAIEVGRAALGEKTFAKAFAAGQGMTPEQALTVARSG